MKAYMSKVIGLALLAGALTVGILWMLAPEQQDPVGVWRVMVVTAALAAVTLALRGLLRLLRR